MAKKVCPKCKGKGCSHCGGTGYHKVEMSKGGDMGKKKMGYAHGGLACGASNKPSQAGTRSIKTS
jgi:hypothetical protein